MEIKSKKLPKSEAEIEVSLSFEEFEPFLKKGAVRLSEERNIEGFRKGKAPYEVVKDKFGESEIFEYGANEAVKKTYPEALEKAVKDIAPKDSFPIGSPEITITKLAPKNNFEYKAKISVFPEVILGDYLKIASKIRSQKKQPEVTEEEITGTLDWIRRSRAPIVAVDRPIQKGDFAEVDFEVRSEGVKIELGDSKNHPVEIGAGKFIPGFEDELVGMKAGETKEFTLKAPKDWYRKEFADKILDFKVYVKSVQERLLPDLTDEFAKTLGSFTGVESLKESVKEGILKEKEEKENQRIRMEIAQKIAEESKIDVPDVMVERELDKMTDELMSGVADMGMKWEDYLIHIKKNTDDLRKEWKDEAIKRVKIALILRGIGLKENLEPSAEEVESRANEILKQYVSIKEAENKIDAESLREYAKGVLRNEKVFKFLENSEVK